MTHKHDTKLLDYELFEYIIAFNCSTNDLYIATIIDSLKLEFINNNHIRQYLEIVFDFYRKRQVIPSGTEILVYLNTEELKQSYKDVVTKFRTLDSQYDYDELLSNTEQFIKEKAVFNAVKTTINDFTNSTQPKDVQSVFNLFNDACNVSLVDNLGFDYFNQIDKHISELTVIDRYIPTGYKWLDKMLGGGWLEGGRALYMFLGATNVGKSIVLGNIAAKILEQNRTVVIISLEMSEQMYTKRISSQLSRISFSHLKNETEMLKKYLIQFKQNHPESNLIVKEFPPNSITVNHITAYIKKLKTKWKVKPDAIILDYLTLLQALTPTGSMYQEGLDVAEQVRALTYPQFFGCPIISAGQINRAGFGEANPELDKTGESIGIPQTADATFSLWQTEAEKELGVLNFGIRKSRFGVNFGKKAFRIDYDTLAIDEMDDVFSNTEDIQLTDNILDSLSKSKS